MKETIIKHSDAILISLISATALLWIGINKGYLFGEDGTVFINPFGYTNSPLLLYSYTKDPTMLVASGQVYFFLYGIDYLINLLLKSYSISEHVLLIGVFFLQTIGFVRLVNAVSRVLNVNKKDALFPKIVSTIFFDFNPFTLSVTYPHILGWTFFYAFIPFLFTAVFKAHYLNERHLIDILLCLVLSLPLAPGLGGSRTVSLGIVIIFFLLLETIQVIFKKRKLRNLIANFSFLSILLLSVAAWITIPLFIYNGNQYASSSNSFLFLFLNESKTTNLLNVTSLLAYSWIYKVPDSYAWIYLLPLLNLDKVLIPTILIIALFLLIKYRKMKSLGLLSIILLLFSEGYNLPFGYLNLLLFKMKGPFLFLANPYYIIGEFYVLLLSVFVFIVLVEVIRNRSFIGYIVSKMEKLSGSKSTKSKIKWNRVGKIAVIFLVLILVMVNITPFVSEKVYQQSGNNISEFKIPNSFRSLESYFKSNYSGPIYYSLSLPLGVSNSVEMKVGNSSFTDSMGFLNSYIPYPTIWDANSQLAVALEDYLSGQNINNLRSVFSAVHIRYIIFDPYLDSSSGYMNKAPDGNLYNYSLIQNILNKTFGKSIGVGHFTVWVNEYTFPILEVGNNFTALESPNYQDYINFIGSLRYQEHSISKEIIDSPPVRVSGSYDTIKFKKFMPPQVDNLTSSSSYFGVYDNGTVKQIFPTNRSIGGPLVKVISFKSGLNNSENSTTETVLINSVKQPIYLQSSINIKALSSNSNYIGYWIYSGNLTATSHIVIPANINKAYIESQVFYNDKPVLWNDVTFPIHLLNDKLNFSIQITQNNLISTLTTNNGIRTYCNLTLGNRSNFQNNVGIDISNYPFNELTFVNYSVTYKMINLQATLNELKIWKLIQLKYIVSTDSNQFPVSSLFINTLSTNSLGDFNVKLTSNASNFWVILAYPYSPLWHLNMKNAQVSHLNNSYINIFYVNSTSRPNHPNDALEINFDDTALDYTIIIPVTELVIMSIIFVVLVRRRRKMNN